MAEENLGTAVLTITVDDKPARNALNLLKQDVQRTAKLASTRTSAKGGARESTDAVEKANSRIVGLQNRINILQAKGVDVTQLRARLTSAISANEQRNFGTVRQITAQLSNTVRLEEGRLRVATLLTAQLRQQASAAAAAESKQSLVTGRGARFGGAREDIRALEKAQERRFRLSQRIETLEERGVDVSRLRYRLGQLTEAQSSRQFGTFRQTGRVLAREITLAERKLRLTEQTQRAERQAARIGARQGGARESIDALTDAQKRRYGLDQQIRSLEAAGINTAKLRAQLGEATTAQANRQFGSFNRIADSLDFTLRKERDKLRVIRDQNTALERQATEGRRIGRLNASPVRGGIAFPGSPGALAAAQAESLRVGRLNAVPIQGGIGFPGSPAAIRAEERLASARERAAQAAQKAAEAEGRRIGRLNALPLQGGKNIPGSPAAIQAEERLAAARDRATRAAERARLAEEKSALAEGRRIGALNAAPIRGGKAFPGSPAFLDSIFPSFPKEYFAKQAREVKAASQKQQDIISNAIIGGAFPLLFGQGIGASIGGAAGGAAGGAIGGQFGFGLSLVGTALGSQFDVAIQKLGALAKALDDPIANFQTLVQNASLSSKELERYAQALIESGRGAEAAAVIQRDLIGTFGSLQGAKEYNDAVDTISRAWSEASTVLASFVAGPLAALIRTLSQPTGGLATGVSFEQLVGQLSPDQFRQVQARREQVTEASRQARGGLSAILPPSNEDVNAGLRAGIALAKELLGIEKQRAELAARIAFAQIQNQKSLSTSYQLIDASTQGYERQSLELQKQQVLNERNRKLLELTDKERNDPTNPKAVKIQQDAALELYRLTQQLNQLDKDRAAQKELEAAQNNIKLQSINRQITATQALSKAERGVARDTLATTQNIQAGIDAAKDREREIGAQIDAARLRGGDAGEQEASRLVEQQKIAANETRLELERGALALTEAGEKLRDDLRNAVLDFTRVRSDPQGLNRFLNPQQRQQRAEFDLRTLLPQFRQAQVRFTQLTGAPAREFSGPIAGVNEAIRNFITLVQAEDQATKNVIGTQEAIAINTADLNRTNAALALKIQELAEKNWAVNVAVSGGQAAVYGDVVNGAISP